MNKIILKGIIKNISFSHKINDTVYNKADIIVKRKDGKEDIITICYKDIAVKYNEDQEISLTGNVRSYSKKLEDRNKVSVYVFTHGDSPIGEIETFNSVEIDGRICKLDKVRKTKDGKNNLHFILANNIFVEAKDQKINSYIPIVVWGEDAFDVEKLSVGDKITIKGELHSRYYKKYQDDGNFEIRVAHEVSAKTVKIEDDKGV